MKNGHYIKVLAQFVTGNIELPEFKQFVEDRLFELRRNPQITDEKRFLSSIELYLHESEEGLRDKSEVYAQVQAILDKIIVPAMTSEATTRWDEIAVPRIRYFLSRTFDIDPDIPQKTKTETKEISISGSK